MAKNGNLYFTTQLEGGKGKEDIVVCKWENGQYLAPQSLPEAINSAGYEFNAFIDPSEQFLIFSAYGRKDGHGGGDLYISRKDNRGNWYPAVNLGNSVNSTGLDYCPFVSWDGEYLFFTSNKTNFKTPFEKPVNYKTLKARLSGPENGLDNIFWVKFEN